MGEPYGGLFLFTQSARMVRPVRHWAGGGGLELIGTLEQGTLDIHCPDGGTGGTPGLRFTHGELSASELLALQSQPQVKHDGCRQLNVKWWLLSESSVPLLMFAAVAAVILHCCTVGMLSVVASLTPYSDYNQSPRNMYQCQMGKQTMGTPAQALQHRTDTKLYRIQTPQTPIARTSR
jgi:DNA-directed RNA polymerase I subunit RPA2